MNKRILGLAAVAALAVSACGSDSDSDSDSSESGGGDLQDLVATLFVSQMEAQQITIDLDCAKAAAAEISDGDAQAIVDAGDEAGPDFSDAALAFSERAVECLDIDTLIDQIVEVVGEEFVDGDCLKDALKDIEPSSLVSGDLPAETEDCFTEE